MGKISVSVFANLGKCSKMRIARGVCDEICAVERTILSENLMLRQFGKLREDK